jgi:glycine dehydrogenase subunit 2
MTTMNNVGRPTRSEVNASAATEIVTFSGNRGLDHEEALIFESGSLRKTGVDLPEPKPVKARLGGLERRGGIGLPACRARTTRSTAGFIRSGRAR